MLSLDPIVKVNLLIGSAALTSSIYDVGLILGSSGVISATDRCKTYTSLAEMTEDGFDDSDDEYAAAAKYFGVSPTPVKLLVAAMDEGETPVQALTAVLSKTNAFYGVYVCGATSQQILDVDTLLGSLNRGVQFYGVSGTVDTATGSSGLFQTLYDRSTRRAFGLFSAHVEDAAAVMGMAMGLASTHVDTAFSLCYKAVASMDVSDLSQSNADAIKALNGNIYVRRGYTRSMLENGAVSSGLRYDDVLYLDMLAGDMQDACLAMIADNAYKLPQTDTTSAMFINSLSAVLESYTSRGVIATGTWSGSAVGSLQTGDTMEHGYYLFIDSYTSQSAADRAAHKAMPITCCLCMAGTVESVQITAYVQQ